MDMCRNVEMIFNAIYPIRVRSVFFNGTPNVFEELCPAIRGQGPFPILCRKDNLIENLRKGAHGVTVTVNFTVWWVISNPIGNSFPVKRMSVFHIGPLQGP